MATLNNRSKILAWGLGLASICMLPAAQASDESLIDMTYLKFVQTYQDSSVSDLDKIQTDIAKAKIDLRLGSNKIKLKEKVDEVAKLQAIDDLQEAFEEDLTKHLGSSDISDLRKKLAEDLQKEIARMSDANEMVEMGQSEKEATIQVRDLGEDSAFAVEQKFWVKDGKLVTTAAVIPKKDAFAKDPSVSDIRNVKKYFDSEAMKKVAAEFSKDVLGSGKVEIDPKADLDKEVPAQFVKLQSHLKMEEGAVQKNLVDVESKAEKAIASAMIEYESLKEKVSPAGGETKLSNLDALAKALKKNKGKSIEACDFLVGTLTKARMDKDDLAECFPAEALAERVGAHGDDEPKARLKKRPDADGVEDEGEGKTDAAQSTSSPPANLPPQMNPMDMQAALQREANTAACLNANQQLMAAIPQMELDKKFNSLLQGFESIITGSTLIPQVLVSIPPDASGPGAYLQAQSAVEDLTKDWNLKDPEVQAKVKKELRAAEIATSKAASDYEAYKFRLTRIGLMDPAIGLPLDSPEGVKLAKLERDMAAAGAVKESMQSIHGTIREMTQKSFGPLNSGLGRTSRASGVPSVGTPRVAPSR
jgi:hypothetical protein